MSARVAGQYTRQMTQRKARRVLTVLAAMTAIAAVLALWGDPSTNGILLVEGLFICGVLLLDRFAVPTVERWGRGAAGEEHIGRLMESLEDYGWLAVHDVDTGRGNIDTIVIGPGGVFTVEVKAHRGRLSVERLEPAMLRQAYAQKKWLEHVVDHPVTALLVFSSAYLVGPPIARRRGVTVLPARMLAGHLRSRPKVFSPEDSRLMHRRLGQALD